MEINMDIVFPFPDRENSMELLKRDPVYKKIAAGEVQRVFDHAWETGVSAAETFLMTHCVPLDFFTIAADNGITVVNSSKDNVAAQTRFYSEFYPKEKKIYMYDGSIRLWCAANGLSLENGRMLIMSHEYFHYLEHTALGWTSKQHQVPMIQIGSLAIGRTGCMSLSEIAANAFAETCFPYLKVEENTPIIYTEDTTANNKPGKKITFWNRRREEIREVYHQFFEF